MDGYSTANVEELKIIEIDGRVVWYRRVSFLGKSSLHSRSSRQPLLDHVWMPKAIISSVQWHLVDHLDDIWIILFSFSDVAVFCWSVGMPTWTAQRQSERTEKYCLLVWYLGLIYGLCHFAGPSLPPVPRAPAQGGARQLESAVSHVTQMPAFVYVIARCDWRVIYSTPISLSVTTRRIPYPDAVVSLSKADFEQLTLMW